MATFVAMLTLYPHASELSLPDRLRILAHHLRRDPADWEALMEAAERIEASRKHPAIDSAGEIVLEPLTDLGPSMGSPTWLHRTM